jgi:hypothetical protein
MTPYDNHAVAMLDWLAGLGAAALVDIAASQSISNAAAAPRLRRLERDGLLEVVRLLHGEPALYAVTRRGLRAAGRPDLSPPHISSSGFAHLLECGRVARVLGCSLGPGYSVHSERELRAWERAAGHAIASAELAWSAAGPRELHRPDLVCVAAGEACAAGLPVAIEVELTVKAPRRLRVIVRAWARSRRVAGVVYYASGAAARALERAIADERAGAQVHVLALARAGELPPTLAADRSTSAIPSAS